MLEQKNTLKSIALVGKDFDPKAIDSIRLYLQSLEPSPELALIKPKQGRINLLNALKQLALNKKEITDLDIISLEFQPDLIIKVGGNDFSLDNSLIIGASYAEIAFCATEAPKFNLDNLRRIIEDFEQRKRNFGS